MVNKIRGIRTRKLWAVFSPDGYLQYRSISDTKKEAKKSVIECHELANNITWKDYAENGWVVNQILVDIKIIIKCITTPRIKKGVNYQKG